MIVKRSKRRNKFWREPHAWTCKGLCVTLDLGKRPRVPTGHKYGNPTYDVGAKRCSVCEVWIWPPVTDNLRNCQCCGHVLRKSAMVRSDTAKARLKRID